MRILVFTLTLFTATTLFSQEYVPSPETEALINEQIWKPFKQSYESRDWKTFNDLHTDDVLRISRWSGIREGNEYKERIKSSFQRSTQRKKSIDFWLEHRIYAENVGYEVGYYRIINTEPGKEKSTSYSRFHVVLKKEDGIWKIAQDWDTGIINGVEVTADDFAKGKPLKLK